MVVRCVEGCDACAVSEAHKVERPRRIKVLGAFVTHLAEKFV